MKIFSHEIPRYTVTEHPCVLLFADSIVTIAVLPAVLVVLLLVIVLLVVAPLAYRYYKKQDFDVKKKMYDSDTVSFPNGDNLYFPPVPTVNVLLPKELNSQDGQV